MTTVYQEPNAIQQIEGILQKENPSSILLVRGNKSYEDSGAKRLIGQQLLGYRVTQISDFYMSPKTDDVRRAIDVINANDIDFIIAVGGGCVMDVAKSASILHNEKGELEDYVTGKIKPAGDNIRRLLVPTTAGTGAEITPFSVVYIDKTKYSMGHKSMVPEYVILAPELTYNLSPRITAQTGCDAIAQAIEGFWSVHATDESKKYSREAIPLLLGNIRKAVNAPDPESRRNMLLGSHYAGKSIAIAKTTAAHALSYPLTSYHKIPHGHAAMLTLPYFFLINEKVDEETIQDGYDVAKARETFAELLRLMKAKDGTEARDMLISIMDDTRLERRLSQLGVTKEDLPNIIANGFNPQRVMNNPAKVTEEMEWDIIREIF